MEKVVKLILICQVKDDKIPQLIPLMWVNSFLAWFLILFILINLYNYNEENDLVKMGRYEYKSIIKLIW